MLIAIISDTHLPRANRRLPQSCVGRIEEVDLIIHAGDFVSFEVLEELRSLGEVVAVSGNVDSREVKAALPATVQVDAGGAAIAVVHNGGPAQNRLERLRRRFPEADAVIFGHSHIPLHERARDGFQIFNPGSPTDKRKARRHTMGMARVDGGRIGFELIELD